MCFKSLGCVSVLIGFFCCFLIESESSCNGSNVRRISFPFIPLATPRGMKLKTQTLSFKGAEQKKNSPSKFLDVRMNMNYAEKNCLIKIPLKSCHPILKMSFRCGRNFVAFLEIGTFFNLYCSYLLVRLVQQFIKSGHPSFKNVFLMRKKPCSVFRNTLWELF